MATHNKFHGKAIHTPFTWVVADATARLALDLNDDNPNDRIYFNDRLCLQLSDNTIWRLSDYATMTWTAITSIAVVITLKRKIKASSTILANTPIDINTAGASYAIAGDALTIESSSNAFVGNNNITVLLNGVYCEKDEDVVWVDDHTITLNKDLLTDNIINIIKQ